MTRIISHLSSRPPPFAGSLALAYSHSIISGKCSFYSQMKSSLNARGKQRDRTGTKCDGKMGEPAIAHIVESRHMEMVAFVTHSCALARRTESTTNERTRYARKFTAAQRKCWNRFFPIVRARLRFHFVFNTFLPFFVFIRRHVRTTTTNRMQWTVGARK